jgi:hypothetical protein
MLRRLVRDESGMTMGLTVIMIVLIGVMGAGLLVFVQRDLDSVVENNRGQRALELADAGVQVAKEQLKDDSDPAHYNGGSDDILWSKSKGGVTLRDLDGSPATEDPVQVVIEYKYDLVQQVDSFVVVSTGTYGDAKRKIEAIFKRTDAISSTPPAYFTRSDLKISGNITSTGASYFAMKNGDVSGSINFGAVVDPMKRWASTDDALSYPNSFNGTPRPALSAGLPGVAVGNVLTLGSGLQISTQVNKGVRSFDKDTVPHVCVPYYRPCEYPAGSGVVLADTQKIGFPFPTERLPNDIEILRRKAQEQEQANPSVDYYKENLAAGTHSITSWPTDADHNTVFFYSFPTWSSNNVVKWDLNLLCTDATRRGVIVVENGNFELSGNRGGFNGTVLVYGGIDPATNDYYPDRGQFHSSGTSCMSGYATSTGNMYLSGNYSAVNIPALTDLTVFVGSMKLTSWRELYE